MSSRFAALSQRDFRVLWFGGLFSFLGIQMQFFLRGILAWELTRRADALGLVFFVFGLALLTGTPLGGVASDRLPKRMVMLVGQVGIVSSAVGMGTVVLAGVVQFWMLLVASVIQGISFGLLRSCRILPRRFEMRPRTRFSISPTAFATCVLIQTSETSFSPRLRC